MPNIETYFLVDFENVKEAGLVCSDKLTEHDHIHIFSTQNNPKINFNILATLNKVDLNIHVVPSGKQSLDMHLASYLGYLIGSNSKTQKKCEYIIISKDTGYDNIILFLKELTKTDITRLPMLNHKKQNNNDTPKIQNSKTSKKAAIKTKQSTSTAKSSLKTKLNAEIQRTISNAGYVNNVSNDVASIVSNCPMDEHFVCNIHNALEQNYNNYMELYKLIKPVVKKYSTNTANIKTTLSSAQVKSTIEQVLKKASFDDNVVSYVSSIAKKYYATENSKYNIHWILVSEYGNKQGLNIYNHIKKYLR
ncbi:hypothetical protein KQI69_04395 [Eubacterium sp. MSJ-13]|uniref:PIN domain-containing protein n=1 Tax=Eubacterium sp. MSJ-13 TaxID=2841513 RepID=UPI001C10C150|nr:PIN domain-containing protein [Eubacterium sp. MSJ-13]MBU5478441.1 hypothetical protein [Eubacterium sp. MSJ-13]